MKAMESMYIKCVGNKIEKSQLRKQFQTLQWKFDKLLKKSKSDFAHEQQVLLIKNRIENTKTFWSSIKCLVPRKKSLIPLKVYTANNIPSDDLSCVLEKWQSDYNALYNSCIIKDHEFMLYINMHYMIMNIMYAL